MGLGFSYQPSYVVLTYYFDRRLGRVIGLTSTGSALGMLIIPPLFQKIISNYSWQGAILILAGFVSNIGVCAALYRPTVLEIKARINVQHEQSYADDLPESKNKNSLSRNLKDLISSVTKQGDFTLLKNIYFVCLLVAYFLYGVSYIIAFHYLYARAVDTGTSKPNAAYLVSAIGVSSCISRLTHGFIIDHHILTAAVLTSLAFFVCGVSCILTPLSDQYPALAMIAVLIGLSSGVYHSTIPTIAKEYAGFHYVSGSMGWMLLMCGGGVILGSYLTGMLRFVVNISSTIKGVEGSLLYY